MYDVDSKSTEYDKDLCDLCVCVGGGISKCLKSERLLLCEVE